MRPQRVLVVDDEPGIRQSLSGVLEDEGYAVDSVGSGEACLAALPGDLAGETVSVHERVELPAVKPLVTHHRRLAVGCPACGTRVVAPVPEAARGTPFGPRLHAVATYLKTFQALSYERLQRAFADLFGLTLSQGGLMTMLRRTQGAFSSKT